MPAALAAAALFSTLGGTPTAAQAASGLEVYTLAGFPGVGLGLGLPVSPQVGLRFDMLGIGNIDRRVTEDGITYDASGSVNRAGFFGDWFPFGGRFRLTGGLLINDMSGDLVASGAGRVLTIGSNTYTLGASDVYRVKVEAPAVSPYLGLGFGHQAAAGAGWGFFGDVGVGFGRLKVDGRAEGPWASQPGLQADIDRETRSVRDSVANLRVIPQVTIGVNYRFR